jgi:ubiquinone/menaquinone biosynthesis C-methylase UbiE
LILPSATVLDLACGYGEFLNNVKAATRHAVDLNSDAVGRLDKSVRFTHTSAADLSKLPPKTMDVVFTSNFLEHLRSKK